ncbi:MAG: DUF1015 domain-containing protein [Bacteroidetes bacterium]|nr:DUF1015 domain-containing protein [Bacteroidota bacterium]
MSKFKPFKGIRPAPHLINEMLHAQFDHVIERHASQISDEEIINWAALKGFSQSDIDESLKYFLKIGIGFRELLAKGLLSEDQQECYYLIGINWYGQWVYGLIGAIGFEEYWTQKIKKHEDTLEENEAELKRITQAIDFNFNPVMLTYKDENAVNMAIEKIALSPFTHQFVSADGLEHCFWVVNSTENIEEIKAAFTNVEEYYIADGHHRIASGSLLAHEKLNEGGNYTSFISMVISASQLQMYEFNRVVKDLNGLTDLEFFEKLEGFFEINEKSEPIRPSIKFEYGMYFNQKWYHLKVKDATQIEPYPLKQLDVSVLRHFVLTPILGIINVRKSDRIAFLDGSKGIEMLIRMVDRGEMKVGFTLCPPSVDELINVANHQEVMPPKATCIEPKLKSGIISRLLSN